METKHKALETVEIKSIDPATRTIWHTITREVPDRSGDVVRIAGMDAADFLKKPTVLVGHDYRSMDPLPIIGECVGFRQEGDRLYAGTRFLDTAGLSQKLADLVNDSWVLHSKGLLGWSIGFIPTEAEDIREGREVKGVNFKAWKLLEYSSVVIPAHQDALTNALKAGEITGEIVKYLAEPEEEMPPAAVVEPETKTAAPEPEPLAPAVVDEIPKPITQVEEKMNEIEKTVEPEAKVAVEPEVKAAPEPARKIMLGDKIRVRSMSEIHATPASGLNEVEQELQKLNDDALIVGTLLRVPPTATKLWNNTLSRSAALRKALDASTSTEGSEWVPTLLSADYIEKFRLEAKVAALFNDVAMPSNPYTLPYVGGLSASNFYLAAESTSDAPSSSTPSTPSSSSQTLTAKKLKARVLFSDELSEDSIIPILPMLRADLAKAGAEALEDVILNGDTTATHLDADVTDSRDRRKAFNGLRDMSALVTATKKDLATFSTATVASIFTAMGKYGIQPSKLAIICSAVGYNKLRLLTDVLTVDKYGANATILNGELGKFLGIPIIVTEYLREDANASGVYDGSTTTKSLLLGVHRPGFIIGTRGGVKLTFQAEGETDQNQLIMSFRKAFQPIWTPSATVQTIGLGYNFA
jgi:HK97 family phage major capsid protein